MPTPDKPMSEKNQATQQVVDWIEQHTDQSPLTDWQRQFIEAVFDPNVKRYDVCVPKRVGRTSLNRQVESALAALRRG